MKVLHHMAPPRRWVGLGRFQMMITLPQTATVTLSAYQLRDKQNPSYPLHI